MEDTQRGYGGRIRMRRVWLHFFRAYIFPLTNAQTSTDYPSYTHAGEYAILSNNLIYMIKHTQINPVIDYRLPLPAGNYMHLPDHSPYTEESHISTIGPLADSYMSASAVKSTGSRQDRVCTPMPQDGHLLSRSGRFLS